MEEIIDIYDDDDDDDDDVFSLKGYLSTEEPLDSLHTLNDIFHHFFGLISLIYCPATKILKRAANE